MFSFAHYLTFAARGPFVTGFAQKHFFVQRVTGAVASANIETGKQNAACNKNPIESRLTMKLLFPLLMSLLPVASVLAQDKGSSPQQPSGAPSPKTTEVMVILTAKPGVAREQIMKTHSIRDPGTGEALSRR